MQTTSTMGTPVTDEGTSRRKFLLLAAVGAIGLAIADAVRITLSFLKPPPVEGFGGTFDVGAPADFPPGSVTHVRQGRFFVVHSDDGLLALFQRCTHLGCLVPWDEAQGHFACPCHAGRYNRVGEVIGGPPPRPFDLFELRIEGGRVIVDTRRATERKRYEPSQAVKV